MQSGLSNAAKFLITQNVYGQVLVSRDSIVTATINLSG